MGEYIDREAMLEQIARRESLMVGNKMISIDALREFIMNRPIVDVEEIMGVETADEFYRIEYRSEDDPHIWTYYADYPVNRYQSALYAFESVSKCSDVVEVRMLKCGIAKHFCKEENTHG